MTSSGIPSAHRKSESGDARQGPPSSSSSKEPALLRFGCLILKEKSCSFFRSKARRSTSLPSSFDLETLLRRFASSLFFSGRFKRWLLAFFKPLLGSSRARLRERLNACHSSVLHSRRPEAAQTLAASISPLRVLVTHPSSEVTQNPFIWRNYP